MIHFGMSLCIKACIKMTVCSVASSGISDRRSSSLFNLQTTTRSFREWNFHIQQFILKYSGNIFSLCWMNVPCLIKLPSWLLTRHFETQEAINVIYGVNTMRDFWKILSIIPCKSRSSGVKINIISSYPCFHALKLHLSANIRISLSLSAWKSDLLLEKPHFGWWKNMTWKILQW